METIIGIISIIAIGLFYHHVQRYISMDKEMAILQHMRVIGQQKYEELHNENEQNKKKVATYEERINQLKDIIEDRLEKQKELLGENHRLHRIEINLDAVASKMAWLSVSARETNDEKLLKICQEVVAIIYPENEKESA